MSDFIYWLLGLVSSLIGHLRDALWDWWNVAIAEWRLRQYERHPERSAPLDDIMDGLSGDAPTFHVGDEVVTWIEARATVTERGIRDGRPIYEVVPLSVPERLTLRGYEMEAPGEF